MGIGSRNININDKYIYYFDNGVKVGYVEYYHTGDPSDNSDHMSMMDIEFYIGMIEVYKEFRGNDYSSKMLDQVKIFAKELGATIITLRVDSGMGFNSRNPDFGLEKLYLRNGFDYLHTPEESEEDDTMNLGAMYYKLR